jgi:hypothetical protein
MNPPQNNSISGCFRFAVQFAKDALYVGSICIAVVFWMLTVAADRVCAGENNKPKTLIPQIANFAGIKVGYSSMEELERQLGKGKVAVGGHPNGARVWRVKGTSLVVYADAFDYSKRGAVVDSFDIMESSNKLDADAPYARLPKDDFALLGEIKLGMDEDKLLETLKRKSLVVSKDTDGWLVKAKGWSPLTSIPNPLQEWTAQFTIKEKSLTGISLYAREKIASK